MHCLSLGHKTALKRTGFVAVAALAFLLGTVVDRGRQGAREFGLRAREIKWGIADIISSGAASVDCSTPMAAFRSYLDSYETQDAAGMYDCMSRRMQLACGCGNSEQFCRQMCNALAPAEGRERVLSYYRSLLPTIEREFARCSQDADRYEVSFAGSFWYEGTLRPSRLVFLKNDQDWRMDIFDVVVPR